MNETIYQTLKCLDSIRYDFNRQPKDLKGMAKVIEEEIINRERRSQITTQIQWHEQQLMCLEKEREVIDNGNANTHNKR